MRTNLITTFDLYYDSCRVKFCAQLAIQRDGVVLALGDSPQDCSTPPLSVWPEVGIRLQIQSLVIDLPYFKCATESVVDSSQLPSTLQSKSASDAEFIVFWDPEASMDHRSIAAGKMLLSLVLVLVVGLQSDGAFFEDAMQLPTYEYDLTYHWLAVCSDDDCSRRVGIATAQTSFAKTSLPLADAKEATITLV